MLLYHFGAMHMVGEGSVVFLPELFSLMFSARSGKEFPLTFASIYFYPLSYQINGATFAIFSVRISPHIQVWLIRSGSEITESIKHSA